MNASTRLSVQKSEAMVQIVGKQPLGNIDNEIHNDKFRARLFKSF